MNTLDNTFSVTDLRHRTNKVLKKVEDVGLVYLLRRSKKEAAVVNIDYLNALQEAYEDYLDVIEFDKTINLKRISLSEHERKISSRK